MLSERQKLCLRTAIQDGLPLTSRPYFTLAQAINSNEESVIATLEDWLKQGLIKRLGLVVKHHELGYTANAMVVWDVPDNLVDVSGQALKKERVVTLCYLRSRQLPQWPYNLYCMIHGQERHWVLDQVKRINEEHQLSQYPNTVLFSRKQFKQRGGRYVAA